MMLLTEELTEFFGEFFCLLLCDSIIIVLWQIIAKLFYYD